MKAGNETRTRDIQLGKPSPITETASLVQESGRDRSECRVVSAHSFKELESVVGGELRIRTARSDRSRNGLGCTSGVRFGVAGHGAVQGPQ